MIKTILLVPIFAIILTACMPTTQQNNSNIESQPVVREETTEMDADINSETPTQTIVEIAINNPDFSTLVTAVQTAGLVNTLNGEGPFTVFAPTNEAFAKLPKATLDTVLKDKELLTKILTYHVVPGKVMSSEVVNLTQAPTVQGQTLKIDTQNGVMINNSKVVATDIEATNGVIHVIDTVLIPE